MKPPAYRVLLLAIALATAPADSWAQGRTRNVVLIVTDGQRWQEVFRGAERALMSRRPGGVGDTTALIRDQILAAARLQLPDVVGLVDLFGRVTDAEVRRVDVRHTPSIRAYSFYTYVLGDHRFGAEFVAGTTTFAVEIEDDVHARCAAF